MEEIFYAVLALHIAKKPIHKDTIRAVLEKAHTPVNEEALEAMSAFIESLQSDRHSKKSFVDPRIVQFFSSVIEQRKQQNDQLGTFYEEFINTIPNTLQLHEETQQKQRVTEEKADTVPLETESTEHEHVHVPLEKIGGKLMGRYVYGIAAGSTELFLGAIGLDGSEVYTISYKDLSAIVHDCPCEPYQSQDEEVVKSWALSHQQVLDEAKNQLGTIIPMGFDVILQPKDEITSSDDMVRNWLKEDYERLCAVVEKIAHKDEYGVQIFYNPKVMGELITKQSEAVKSIQQEMATKSPGLAYMYKQKLEKAVKAEMERYADDWFKDFYTRIKRHADDIVVEKVKKADKDTVMLLNLSCLVSQENRESLGKELEDIDALQGISVRFTGPWPCYSFVSHPLQAQEHA